MTAMVLPGVAVTPVCGPFQGGEGTLAAFTCWRMSSREGIWSRPRAEAAGQVIAKRKRATADSIFLYTSMQSLLLLLTIFLFPEEIGA